MKKKEQINLEFGLFEVTGSLLKTLKHTIKKELEKKGLKFSPEEFHIFILIIYKKFNSVSKLCGAHSGTHKSNISRIIKSLETKGYIKEEIDCLDRRKKIFTCATVELQESINNIVLNTIEQFKEKVGEDKVNTFIQIGLEMLDINENI